MLYQPLTEKGQSKVLYSVFFLLLLSSEGSEEKSKKKILNCVVDGLSVGIGREDKFNHFNNTD